MGLERRITLPYFVTVLGVSLMAISAVFTAVRGMLIRAAFRGGGGFGGGRQFGNAGPLVGLASLLTILAVILSIVGVAWLGLTLRKSQASKT